MEIYSVSVPENKATFFLEFLELLGAKYRKESEDSFEINEEQKKKLDKALEQDKKTFISRDDISRKYKL